MPQTTNILSKPGMLGALALVAALLAPLGGVLGDEVRINRMPYPVQVVNSQDFALAYQLGPNVQTRALDQIERIHIDALPTLAEAEDLRLAGQAADAVAKYDQALEAARVEWQRRLIRFRRLRALDEAGMIDRAVMEWLALVEENRNSPASLAARPRHAGPAGSEVNDRMLQLLQNRMPAAGNAQLAEAMQAVVVTITERQGRAPARTASVPGRGNGPGAAGPIGRQAIRLREVAAQAQRGEHAAVVSAIHSGLGSLRQEELAEGLSLLGKSQLALARERRDGGLLVQAGLNLMRTAVWFPTSPQAPEALFLAGEINMQLGNRPAATKAWERVVSQYGSSPLAERARRALEQRGGQ